MTERLLQFIWQFQYFNKSQLKTIEGEHLHIISAGQYNTNQGPDFSDAKIRIGSTVWAGTVELHVLSSDWNKHKHQQDSRYGNVVLHVVWEDDRRPNTIPVLELKDRVPKIVLQRYEELMNAVSFIPCEKNMHAVKEITWISWKDRMLAERLTRKAGKVRRMLLENKGHWEETCWWLLARNFGMQVNSDAFESVARSIPFNILAKYRNQLHQLEALLLGQAGLLQGKFEEHYPILLQKEYRFQKNKNKFKPACAPMLFLRMRPGNFPTIRLAQLAMLIHHSAHLFSAIKEKASLKDIKDCFGITANDYWHYHYQFDKPSGFKEKKLGAAMIDNIIINTVCPVLFAYGDYHDEQHYKAKALLWLQETLAESSAITRGFRKAGIEACTAADSQALIELKTMYCDLKRCLDCSIGNAILKTRDNGQRG